MVDCGEDFGARPVVESQRQYGARLVAPLAEDVHIGVPEAVDRLELVTDKEQFLAGDQIDQVALEAVGVLELVDHHRPEAPGLALPDLLVLAQQVARGQLQILEVDAGLTFFRTRVRAREGLEQLLEQITVAGRQLVERRLLNGLARGFVAREAFARSAPRGELGEVEQSFGLAVVLEQLEHAGGLCALFLVPVLVHEAARGLSERFDALRQRGALAEAELERAAGGPQRLVDAGQHPSQAAGAVGREQTQAARIVASAELGQSLLERLTAEHTRLAVVEHAKTGVESGREGIRLQEPMAEAVNRRDPGAVELAREIVPAAVEQLAADAAPQLAGRTLRVCDHEHRADVEALVADRLREPLHEHQRLAGACARGDEDVPTRFDRGSLLRIDPRKMLRIFRGVGRSPRFARETEFLHARLTRHIRQSSHQGGQSPPFGSWRTSPPRIRSTKPRASSSARST